MERNLRFWVIAGLSLSLALWTGGFAFAADGDAAAAEAVATDTAALDPSVLKEALLSDPAFKGLPPEEQDALLKQATGDVSRGLSTAREATGAAGQDPRGLATATGQAGIIVAGPGNEGPVGGHVPTVGEQEVMMQEADARREVLVKQGLSPDAIDKQIQDEFKQKYGGEGHEGYGHGGREEDFLEDMPIPWDPDREGGLEGRPTFEGTTKEKGYTPEQMEKFREMEREYREHGSYEHGGRELGGTSEQPSTREVEHYTPESQREAPESYTRDASDAIERSIIEVEHNYEAPTMEQQPREMEYTGGGEMHY